MTVRTPALTLELDGRTWRVGSEQHDLSIPLAFDEPQPTFFGAPRAREHVVRAGAFVGDVREGGSCNCSTYTLTPHCNGTHTECAGHLTRDRMSVRDACTAALHVALLVSVAPVAARETDESSDPEPAPSDMLVTRAALEAAANTLAFPSFDALVVRTMPNDETKRSRDYDRQPAAFFSAEAIRWIVARNVEHLVTDLPSLDRANDHGRLTAHRLFWSLPPRATVLADNTRRHATVTELAFVPNTVFDGAYLLNLQVAPFAGDAAPSRPILLPLQAV